MELTKFELSILTRVAFKYPFVKSHLPLLRVKSRELTGVGMYTNFEYINYDLNVIDVYDKKYIALTTDEIIKIKGLTNGLQYYVDYTNGKLLFIEVVTCDEAWDGNTLDFYW